MEPIQVNPMGPMSAKHTTNRSFLIIIVVLLLAVGGYFAYAKYGPSSSDMPMTAQDLPKSPYADESFSFATTIEGKKCTMNVCSGGNKCIPLSGSVSETGSCTLDRKQSTPEAQGLLNIVAPN